MKQYFEAIDGTRFESEEECANYELMAKNRDTIQQWCQFKYGDKQGQATAALGRIMRWEMDRKAVLTHSFVYPEVDTSEVDEEAQAVSEDA